MSDHVYVLREGENPELRYSLRSLVNVDPGLVWVVGGAPVWINPETVTHLPRTNTGSAYAATRGHLAKACKTEEISDPFWLWNDDYYAMRPTELVVRHRGSLAGLDERYAKTPTVWARGLHEVAQYLIPRYENPLSYDIHLPILVHKEEMLEALEIAKTFKSDSVHLLTLYGNICPLGGIETADPKMLRKSSPFPRGDWLSSSDGTFRSCIEPVLRYTFPDASPYERY